MGLRKEIANFQLLHPETPSCDSAGSSYSKRAIDEAGVNLENYTKDMATSKKYGGLFEIDAYARMRKKNIAVFVKDPTSKGIFRPFSFTRVPGATETANLLYHHAEHERNRHYDALTDVVAIGSVPGDTGKKKRELSDEQKAKRAVKAAAKSADKAANEEAKQADRAAAATAEREAKREAAKAKEADKAAATAEREAKREAAKAAKASKEAETKATREAEKAAKITAAKTAKALKEAEKKSAREEAKAGKAAAKKALKKSKRENAQKKSVGVAASAAPVVADKDAASKADAAENASAASAAAAAAFPPPDAQKATVEVTRASKQKATRALAKEAKEAEKAAERERKKAAAQAEKADKKAAAQAEKADKARALRERQAAELNEKLGRSNEARVIQEKDKQDRRNKIAAACADERSRQAAQLKAKQNQAPNAESRDARRFIDKFLSDIPFCTCVVSLPSISLPSCHQNPDKRKSVPRCALSKMAELACPSWKMKMTQNTSSVRFVSVLCSCEENTRAELPKAKKTKTKEAYRKTKRLVYLRTRATLMRK